MRERFWRNFAKNGEAASAVPSPPCPDEGLNGSKLEVRNSADVFAAELQKAQEECNACFSRRITVA
jgi:hypothetical protein